VNLQAFLDSFSARSQDNTKTESSAYHIPNPDSSASRPIEVPSTTSHNGAHTGDEKDVVQPASPSNQLQSVANLPNVPLVPAPSISHPLPNIPPPLVSHKTQNPGQASVANANTGDDGPFPPELERPYEEFLHDERINVSEGNWEKFPEGSRLFIGE
jgi:hypothetical protein